MRWLMLAAVLLIAVSLTRAQESEIEPLPPNTPIIARIEAGEVTQYAIGARGGERITVSARSLQMIGALDPVLRIVDSNGTLLAYNDNHESDRIDLRADDALISGFELRSPGVYLVQVSARDERHFGNVELLLTFDGRLPTPTTPPASLDTDTVTGYVPNGGAFIFALAVNAGDAYRITARALDNGFDPYLEVVTLDGEVIAFNHDHNSGDTSIGLNDARIESIAFDQDGVYEIRVSGFAGFGGNVALSIESIATPTPTAATPQPAATSPTVSEVQVLSDDLQVVREVVRPNEAYIHRFSAQPGEVYTITVRTRSTTLDPRVALYYQQDTLIAANDAHGTDDTGLEARDARLHNVIITRRGEYQVHVRGYGESAGDFLLTIERVARNAPVTTGMTQTITGSVGAAQIALFRFEANAGDYVTLAARGIDDFNPRLTLTTDDLAPLYSNIDHGMSDPSLAFHDSLIPNYRIETSGHYRVQVASSDGVAGAFELAITIRRAR